MEIAKSAVVSSYFLSYCINKVKEIKPTMPSAVDENTHDTSCNTSPLRIWEISAGSQCGQSALLQQQWQGCVSAAGAAASEGKPSSRLLPSRDLDTCRSLLQSRQCWSMLRGPSQSQLEKDKWTLPCMQSHCPFLLGLYLSSVLLSRYLPFWGEELSFLQCESEWKISQNNDASMPGTVCQKVRMSFGLLLHSRQILADTWPT